MRRESLREVIATYERGVGVDGLAPRIAALSEAERLVMAAWVAARLARRRGVSEVSEFLGGTSAAGDLCDEIAKRGFVTNADVDRVKALPQLDRCTIKALLVAEYARKHGLEAAVEFVKRSMGVR